MNLKHRWYFFFLTYVYVITLYLTANHFTANRAHFLPLTPLDIKIPFWPWTALIYISVYFLPLTVGFLADRDADVAPIVFAYVGMATLCNVVFFLFPTTYPRPPVGQEIMPGVLHFVRLLDTPANCMPSQHVALGFLSAFFIQRYRARLGMMALFLGILIAFSTLTTKQHYIWDVLAGYFVARLTFIVVSLKLPARARVAR